MRVKCVLCEKIEKIESGSPLAKKLRNRPIHTYMCESCDERIGNRTKERKETGNFKLFHQDESTDEW
ncbi:YlaI family protein [Pseudalkalibacillus hwajinpoensis]|uniref:YlaI family protein n=1 Tax=Guptibacillus hwajinpoensis TaxID=208199 RepID=UPI00325AAF76